MTAKKSEFASSMNFFLHQMNALGPPIHHFHRIVKFFPNYFHKFLSFFSLFHKDYEANFFAQTHFLHSHFAKPSDSGPGIDRLLEIHKITSGGEAPERLLSYRRSGGKDESHTHSFGVLTEDFELDQSEMQVCSCRSRINLSWSNLVIDFA